MTEQIKYVYITDDDKDDVQMFQEAFTKCCPDFKLIVANNGLELMQMLPENPKPVAIVLDLNMPLKDGKECLREIRTSDEFKDVVVVVLSTSKDNTEIDNCFSLGADRYYVKPNSLDEETHITASICQFIVSSVTSVA